MTSNLVIAVTVFNSRAMENQLTEPVYEVFEMV
jgi:hypothetical protein